MMELESSQPCIPCFLAPGSLSSTSTTVPPTGWTYYRPPSLGAPGGWLPEHSITVTQGRLDTPEIIDINIQGEARGGQLLWCNVP